MLGWQPTKTPSPAERFVDLRTVAAAEKGVFATPSLSRPTVCRSDRIQVVSGIGDRVWGIGDRGSVMRGERREARGEGRGVWGVGCGVWGLSVFPYRGSPLPSRDWSLVTGKWEVGIGKWAFNALILMFRFRLSVCDLPLSASAARFLVLNAVYAGWP